MRRRLNAKTQVAGVRLAPHDGGWVTPWETAPKAHQPEASHRPTRAQHKDVHTHPKSTSSPTGRHHHTRLRGFPPRTADQSWTAGSTIGESKRGQSTQYPGGGSLILWSDSFLCDTPLPQILLLPHQAAPVLAAFLAFLITRGSNPGHMSTRAVTVKEWDTTAPVEEGKLKCQQHAPEAKVNRKVPRQRWAIPAASDWARALPRRHLWPGGWRQPSLDNPQVPGANDCAHWCARARSTPHKCRNLRRNKDGGTAQTLGHCIRAEITSSVKHPSYTGREASKELSPGQRLRLVKS